MYLECEKRGELNLNKFRTIEEIENAITTGQISTTPQLRYALALLEISIDGSSGKSKKVLGHHNDMRKALIARKHHIYKS